MIRQVNRPFYLLIRSLLKLKCQFVFFLLQGFRVRGKEYLPRKRQPLLLIANHAAFIDSVYLICAIRPRFTICGARPKYFKRFFTRHLFRTANILKVENRDQFLADCGMLSAKGEILLIYPEMGRNPEGMGEFKTWAAEVALEHGVDAIPCYLYGTTRGQSGRKRLYVGKAIPPSGTPESLTEIYFNEIKSLKPNDLPKDSP
jgi:1-acyl-sn-glycerol-3-phosphate acyltransferase